MKTPVYLSKFSLYLFAILLLTAFLAYFAGRGGIGWLGMFLALLPGVLAGAFLILGLRRIESALEGLRHGRAHKLPARWGDPFGELAGQVNELAALSSGEGAEIAGLRQGLFRQIEDAAAQQERNRLARELHDSIKQQLFSIQMNAAAAQARLAEDVQGAQQALADVRQDTSAGLVEMDVLLQQLSPAPLEKVGLAQALREQCEALGYRSGAQVTCEIGELPADDSLAPGAQEALFRIAQEALSNIARHARCQHAWLRLALDENGQLLLLEVRDDGQGFDPDQATQGRGLNSIRQRLEDLAGNFWLESAPGRGTLLRAALPCAQPVNAGEEAVSTGAATNRVALVGLAGGLLLAAWLYFAPALQLQASWAAVLQVVGLALLIGVGWLATRLASNGGVLSGAAAGGVAGMVAFGLVGAAFGAQRGAQSLLAHGLAPAADENQALVLIIDSLTGMFGWTQAYYWGLFLAGISLGALGALAAGRFALPQLPVDWRRDAALLAIVTAVGGGLAFVANCFTFTTLESAVIRQISEKNLAGVSPQTFSRVMVWSLLTPAFFYLGALVWRLQMLAAERQKKSAFEMERLSWEAFWIALGSLILGGVVLVTLGWGWLTGESGDMALAADMVALASLGLGALFLVELGRVRQQMSDLGLPLSPVSQYMAAALGPLIPVTLVVGLIVFGTGWPALFIAVVELGLLLRLRALLAINAPRKVRAQIASKALATRLAGSWLGASLALALPGQGIIAASLGAVLFSVRVIEFFFGTQLAKSSTLTVEQMLLENFLYQALGFAANLLLACIAMGIVLAVVSLAAATRQRSV